MSLKYRTSAGTSASNFSDLVVKVGDTLPIGTEVNYDGQTAPAGWQEVDDPNTYSTTETKIGTWIDGKPLYRKVLSFALQNSSVHLIQHNISNVDIIFLKDFFCWKPSSGINRSLDYTYNTDTNYAQVNRTVFQYLITNKQDPGDALGYAILEYTKTTD